MKNLFLFSTDKPTRLFTSNSELTLAGYPITTFKTGKHIYITNSEEIKEGQNYIGDGFSGKNKFKWHKSQVELYPNIKKDIIILTTDLELIKDGVQAIDDEFLEWFVKNPSCEEVEVEIESKFDRVDGHYHDVWEIIIPKEEPKQETLKEACDNCNNDICCCTIRKQETLEEVAYNYAKDKVNRTSHLIRFRKGAKWQKEQCKKDLDAHLDVAEHLWLQVAKKNKKLYSEEDMKIAFDANIKDWISFEEFIKQFKKK